MSKKKIIEIVLILLGIGLLTGGGVALYLFNMPHRNVQGAKTDFSLNASEIVNEYLSNPSKANEKYLDKDGDSKILEVKGTVSEITDDFQGNKVILLKAANDKAGVSCTLTPETNSKAETIHAGEVVTLKGVIRSGASYDEDLEMYENVIMEKCDIIIK